MFSKACEYGIKAVVYIATQSLEGVRVKTGDVASKAGLPEAFTAKILGALTKSGIVSSLKGPYGGFEVNLNSMKQVTVDQIVCAIDGTAAYDGCVLGLKECSCENPCPMHDKFEGVRAELQKALQSTTIYDLAIQLKAGKSVLAR